MDAPSGLFDVFQLNWHENSIGCGEQNNLQVIKLCEDMKNAEYNNKNKQCVDRCSDRKHAT